VEYYVSGGVNYAIEVETTAAPEPTPTPPAGSALVSVDPAVQTVSLNGDDFTVAITITGVTNLGSFEFSLGFDPVLLQAQNVTLGDLLGSTGRDITPVGPSIDNVNGQLAFGAFSFGSEEGPSGSGTLAVITFSPRAAGTSSLSIENVQMTDTAAVPIITAILSNGLVMITGNQYSADVDADGDVDIVDVQMVAARWGAQRGDASYGDGRCDLNKDGVINIVDIQIVAGQCQWGSSP